MIAKPEDTDLTFSHGTPKLQLSKIAGRLSTIAL